MKNTVFYICPVCGNLIFSASPAGVQCCGRTLEPQKPRKAEEHQRLHTEPVEDEWYITTDHPMTKTEHIAFAALLSGRSLRVWRQYRMGLPAAALPAGTWSAGVVQHPGRPALSAHLSLYTNEKTPSVL